MEPFEIQRKLCREIRDALYPLGAPRGLYVLPFNRHVAAEEGSPGWVWLSPVNEKACHQYGKFVVRLDGDNVSVGYAVERGFPPEVAAALDCKPLGPDWMWHRVAADMRSGKMAEAVMAARTAGSPLIICTAISDPKMNCTMALDDAGRLSVVASIPGISNNAAAVMACRTLAEVPDVLDDVGSTAYVDLQFLVTFDVSAGPGKLWRPSQFCASLLKHFEPWVSFRS